MNLNFLGQAAHGTTTTSLLGLLGAAWVLSAMACGADTDTRLGAAGEECFDDFDCREPLVCLEATCAVEGSNSGTTTSNNISTSNATNNSTSSNTSTNNGDIPVDREEGCVLVCERLVE
ncbi:MAG: hypothetical protein AAFX99_17780, partial [Myxococcota bacterium]